MTSITMGADDVLRYIQRAKGAGAKKYDAEQFSERTPRPHYQRKYRPLKVVAFAPDERLVDPMLFGFEEHLVRVGGNGSVGPEDRIRLTIRYDGQFVGAQVLHRRHLQSEIELWKRGDYDELVERVVTLANLRV